MKTPEQLRKLSTNPFYNMTEEETEVLRTADNEETIGASKKKVSSKGNAAVKETGKLNKQHGDPAGE